MEAFEIKRRPIYRAEKLMQFHIQLMNFHEAPRSCRCTDRHRVEFWIFSRQGIIFWIDVRPFHSRRRALMDHNFIDSDEGYRPIDWDSHLSEPFFAEALPCESCGKPVDCERLPASWDESLLVGPAMGAMYCSGRYYPGDGALHMARIVRSALWQVEERT